MTGELFPAIGSAEVWHHKEKLISFLHQKTNRLHGRYCRFYFVFKLPASRATKSVNQLKAIMQKLANKSVKPSAR